MPLDPHAVHEIICALIKIRVNEFDVPAADSLQTASEIPSFDSSIFA